MKIVIIVQARMGSTRFPGKMMMGLGSKKVVDYVFDRAGLIKNVDDVYLATTDRKKDDILVKWAEENNVNYFRGSENDVLDRYYQTAKKSGADVVVRLTGDCPLLDPVVVAKVVQDFLDSDFDYVANNHPATYPDGLDTEVFSFAALEKAWKEAKLSSEREHVTPYIWKNPTIFKIKNVANDEDWSNERWTLDTKEDWEFLRKVVAECEQQTEFCGMEEVLKIIKDNPEWRSINSIYDRDEGYAKSVKEEK